MERDMIFVRKEGLIEANIDRTLGVAKDDRRRYYVWTEVAPDTFRWIPENLFWEKYLKEEKGGLLVDYGVSLTDPKRDLLHKIVSRDEEIYQYQLDSSGYVKCNLVAVAKKFEPFAPEGMRSRNGRHLRVRKVFT